MHNNAKNTLTHWMHKTGLILLLAMMSGLAAAVEQVTYYHLDALGSPVAATDETGAVIWREAYRPYGSRLRGEDGGTNELWYTGKPEDKATGLSYFGARWYDPRLGRFMAIDPVGFKEGNIQSFNRYAYANNNPYKFVDPDGREAIFDQYADSDEHSATGRDIGIAISVTLGAPVSLLASALSPEAALVFGILSTGGDVEGVIGRGVTKGTDKLNPKLIQENPRNLIPIQTKSEMSGSQVKRLTKDMKQNGFDQSKPVDAWRNPNTGRLEIQDGHHRTEAAKKAGLDKIPVQVRD